MPNEYYQLYNHAYSFASSEVNSGGVTYSLPQNDYGIYGQHVDAFFNTISRSEGATGSLAVWFVSDKGLTYYTHSLGATAAITGYVQSRFPITSSSEGLGLIDLRGSPDWVKIVGDGIVGPTRGSTASVYATDSTQYVNGIKAVFGLLKSEYPSIDWAIAGLPHLPFVMAYAPPVGQSPTWDPSLTNTGGYTAPTWWDPKHPTGSSAADFYSWANSPKNLSSFYEILVADGIQNMVFDNCSVDWICPDIRIPYADSLPFYEFGNDSVANHRRNKRLCELSSSKAKGILAKSYPMISTMYPSRPLNKYDDPESEYTSSEVTDLYMSIDGESYVGVSANASDGYYPSITYRYDMIQAAIDGTADGFIFFDPAPSLVEIACTSDISIGATGHDSQIRARNMISTMMYGGTYEDGYAPSGSGFSDPCVKSELLRFTSKRTIGYLDDIRESVNLSAYGGQNRGYFNGWIRGANDPSMSKITYDVKESTNRPTSDSIYGEQYWSQQNFDGNCDCPCPFTTQQGALGCCCITVKQSPPEGDDCPNPCDKITITLYPLSTPSCNNTECCTNNFTVDVTPIIPPCDPPPDEDTYSCNRSVVINGSCACISAIHNSGGGCNGICLDCSCPYDDSTSESGCQDIEDQLQNSSDYGLILDVKNYKRSEPNTRNFFLYRFDNERYIDWHLIYRSTLNNELYATSVQAAETILKPSVSVDALRTHLNKEVLRHLPNQYFTT